MKTDLINTNLIPIERITRRKQRVVWSRWAVVCSLCLLVCGVPVAAILVFPASSKGILAARVEENSGQISTVVHSNAELNRRLVRLEAQAEAVSILERRIDWRGIFRGLSIAAGEDVWFDQVQCGTQTDQAADRVEVQIRGYAMTQGQTRQFVVSLEQLGLFDEVILTETTRVRVDDTDQLRFAITLILDPTLVAKGGGT